MVCGFGCMHVWTEYRIHYIRTVDERIAARNVKREALISVYGMIVETWAARVCNLETPTECGLDNGRRMKNVAPGILAGWKNIQRGGGCGQ